MTLLNDFYKIDSRNNEGDDVLFYISLLPGYCAYKGHFPGRPVSPGVCNIQMIKECAEQVTNRRLFLGYIAQCRFLAVITPQTTSQLKLRIGSCQVSLLPEMYKIHATLYDDVTIYVEFKGEFTTEN